ncbi:hypothetical protein FOPE_09131 [Fonsecaea pedrosoi]|nr:hypothetical protein FOPE_09131 [Fonsecaea pedrosoi]
MLNPLAPSPLAFFPPLYTTRPWQITSVRQFWSFGWHRLFARLFLVYGIRPGGWVERQLLKKGPDSPADIGKVIGAFLSSACVHAFSVRGVLAGDWSMAVGEAKFFALNGVAVALEGVVVSWEGSGGSPCCCGQVGILREVGSRQALCARWPFCDRRNLDIERV